MPAINQVQLSSLIDVNYLLINRIFVLVVTLLFFVSVLLLRKNRGQEIHSRVTAPIKLSLLGFLLLYCEMALSSVPSYRALLEGLQTLVVLFCLAKLVTYLVVDIYLRLHTKREVPSFLRDGVRLVVYIAVAIISLRMVFKVDLSAIVTTSAVLTAAIAFAMQNTLANALSGYSIQTDRLLDRQNWISIKGQNLFGEIVNVGFRYTTLRGLDNTLNLVPNSVIMQNVVTVLGSCDTEDKPAINLEILLNYGTPPEKAKEMLLAVLRNDSEVLDTPEPMVRLWALSDSGITYMLVFWIADPSRRNPVKDGIYSQAWYAVNREGSSFPFPHRQIVTAEIPPPFVFSRELIAGNLQKSELFAMLDAATIASLAEQAPVRVFGPGEVVVRQGDGGNSLFIVLKGELGVSVDGTAVGTIRQDSFFGEMSLLTGEPRSATVRASCEVWLAEITKGLMHPLLKANPAIMETLSTILAERERRTTESVAGSEEQLSGLSRREEYLRSLKQFFGF